MMIQSLSYNCMFAAANRRLADIAQAIGEKLPSDIIRSIEKSKKSLNELWMPELEQFGHRNLRTGELVPVAGIAMLLPLYSGVISQERAKQLAQTMTDPKRFWLKYPVPSVPQDSTHFDPRRYWQGPTWVNMNWILIQGLQNYGFTKEAKQLRQRTLTMIEQAGCYEYFSPLDGAGAGIKDFSWTAALAVDLLSSNPK